jgi:hypothetical protein
MKTLVETIALFERLGAAGYRPASADGFARTRRLTAQIVARRALPADVHRCDVVIAEHQVEVVHTGGAA